MVDQHNNLELNMSAQEKYSKLSFKFGLYGWLGFLGLSLWAFTRAVMIANDERRLSGDPSWSVELSIFSVAIRLFAVVILIAVMLFGIYFGKKGKLYSRRGLVISVLGLIVIFLSSPIILAWLGVIGFRAGL